MIVVCDGGGGGGRGGEEDEGGSERMERIGWGGGVGSCCGEWNKG